MSATTDHNDLFLLESSTSLQLPTKKTDIHVFKHQESSFRVVFVNLPGPLCSATIVVPTTSDNDKGLPHTLEHLIFCGSHQYPNRGYLDYLATRALSTGTNAYTTEDHTGYTITTAGSEGLLALLSVYLDHILRPTLRSEQFVTEVYHLDGEAKHQGVVYCEMASRENTEADLLDLHLRRLLYNNQTTYSFECGGLSKSIQLLSNDEIRSYHEKFYHLDNLTLVLCGPIDPNETFCKLKDGLVDWKKNSLVRPKIQPVIAPELKFIGKKANFNNKNKTNKKVISTTIPFPSEDESIGSIAYGWRGPPSNDIFNLLALDIFFRSLQDTSASPLSQVFVERADPLASDVDYDVKCYVDTSLVLLFSGVPYDDDEEEKEEELVDGSDDDEEDESMSDEDRSDLDNEESMDTDDQDTEDIDCFEDGVYYEKVYSTIENAVSNLTQEKIQWAISRHRRKMIEALEEDPHEYVSQTIILDIVRMYLGQKETSSNTDTSSSSVSIGSRAQAFNILNQLYSQPLSFWKDLAKKWLLDSMVVEVKMVPDAELAEDMAKTEQKEHKKRIKKLGKKGLQELDKIVKESVRANEVNIPSSLLQTMPNIPDLKRIQKLPVEMSTKVLDNYALSNPFSAVQFVRTDTAFMHVRLGVNTQNLSTHLRPYLVLFQELMFQSALHLNDDLSSPIFKSYQEVVQYTSTIAISHEVAIGFGNELWQASWLSDMFMMSVSCEKEHVNEVVMLLIQVLFRTWFNDKERIITTAKNLLSMITESKRGGPDMLISVLTRLTFGPIKNTSCNDLFITIFRQEDLLKSVIKQLKKDDTSVINSLNDLRKELLVNQSQVGGFLQFATPLEENEKDVKQVEQLFKNIWEEESKRFSTLYNDCNNNEMKAQAPQSTVNRASPFPFPRQPYSIETHLDRTFTNAVMVPISGLQTSFFTQVVPCDVMSKHSITDYYPVVVLTELLSRTEGPLYTAIRGNGLAYGAYLELYMWTGQLVFDVQDSSEPYRALMEFYRILNELDTEEGFNELCDPFHVDTAKAAIAFRHISSKASAGSIVFSSLRSVFRGFKTLQEEDEFQFKLAEVTVRDIKRVYDVYFKQFVKDDRRLTLMTTVPGEAAQNLCQTFKSSDIEFNVCDLNHFKI